MWRIIEHGRVKSAFGDNSIQEKIETNQTEWKQRERERERERERKNNRKVT